jgi:hypothetical protein
MREQLRNVPDVLHVILPSNELGVTQGVLSLYHEKPQRVTMRVVRDDAEARDGEVAIFGGVPRIAAIDTYHIFFNIIHVYSSRVPLAPCLKVLNDARFEINLYKSKIFPL